MKRFISLILSLTFVLVLAGCNNRSMNYIIENEPSVYYDGNVMETAPLKVGTVYAITLKTPANRTENEKS